MNIIWVNVLFLASLAVFGGLVAAVGAVLVDRWLKNRQEERQRRDLTEGYAPSDIIPIQRDGGHDDER